jgi:DNA excision repair protein ERCC-1
MSGKPPVHNPYARKRSINKGHKSGINLQQKGDNGKAKDDSIVRKRKNRPPTISEDTVNARGSHSASTFSQAFDRSELSPIKKIRGSGPCVDQSSPIADNPPPANLDVRLRNNSATQDVLAISQPHVLHVSRKQRGNGLLRYLRNVPFAFSNIVGPDYIISPNQCALFLSMKYHNLHPNYIHRRIAEMKNDFDLRVLLCLVDVCDNAVTLMFLNKLCAVNNLTLLLAWSEEEAGKETPHLRLLLHIYSLTSTWYEIRSYSARYLETIKAYEGKDASLIKKKKETTFVEQVSDNLSTIRSVNKTDSAQLLSQFGNLKSLITAPLEELGCCPGIGDKKAYRLYHAFHKPFSSVKKKKLGEERNNLSETIGNTTSKPSSTIESNLA